MQDWKIFEHDCVSYLNEVYGSEHIIFLSQGSYNSFASDIEVSHKTIVLFYMETKMKKAQSGQFVLLNDGSEFSYSSKNKNEINYFSEQILLHINDNYSKYSNVSTKSIDIDLPVSIFNEWIVKHYKNKQSSYIITKYQDNYIIFPIEKYSEYFDITANFRIKKSGSRSLSKNQLENFYESFSLENNGTLLCKNRKYYIETDNPVKRLKLEGEEFNYQLNLVNSFNNKYEYEIRMLSRTANPNVIFSVTLNKKCQEQEDLTLFRNSIQNSILKLNLK